MSNELSDCECVGDQTGQLSPTWCLTHHQSVWTCLSQSAAPVAPASDKCPYCDGDGLYRSPATRFTGPCPRCSRPASGLDLEAIKEKLSIPFAPAVLAGTLKRLTQTEAELLGTHIPALLSEVERLRGELSWIDSILARRPALDNKASRAAKIEHAINVAKRAGEAEAEIATLKAVYQNAETLIRAVDNVLRSWVPDHPNALPHDLAMLLGQRLDAATLKAGPQEGSWEWALSMLDSGHMVIWEEAKQRARIYIDKNRLIACQARNPKTGTWYETDFIFSRADFSRMNWQIVAEPASTEQE